MQSTNLQHIRRLIENKGGRWNYVGKSRGGSHIHLVFISDAWELYYDDVAYDEFYTYGEAKQAAVKAVS